MNLKDYINAKKVAKPSPAPEKIEDTINTYSKMNEEQLMGELFSVANKEKAEGKLDNDMLDNFYNTASNYLSPEQRERMQELIIGLKDK